MADTLKHLFIYLKQTSVIASDKYLVDKLNSIEKFASSDSQKAYLLGHFFKHIFDSDKLSPNDKSHLVDTITSNNLKKYFYLKKETNIDSYKILIYSVIIIGLFAIASGTVQLVNKHFYFGLGTKYIVQVVREGGQTIIFGLVCFIGGLLRLKFELQKSKFLKTFLSTKNNYH